MIEIVKKAARVVLQGDNDKVSIQEPTQLVVADVDKAYVDNQDKAMKEYADAQHVEMVRDLEAGINEAMSIAKGAARSEVYNDYYRMWDGLGSENKDFLKVPDHVLIRDVGVPDLWVMAVSDEWVGYEFYTSKQVVEDLETNGSITIGYFTLGMLETQKVDLSDYAKTEQIPVIETTLKENGAYTLTITQGVE